MTIKISLTTLFAFAATGVLFADNESYDGQDVSERVFINKSMTNSSWEGCIARNIWFNTPYSVVSSSLSSSYTNLSNATFKGADLTGSCFRGVTISGANFTDAVVKGADFFRAQGFTTDQLKSTKSWKDKDIVGMNLGGQDLSEMNFSGMDLTGVGFASATLTGVDFYNAVIEDAAFTAAVGFNLAQLTSTSSYKRKNLAGVGLGSLNLSQADFSGFDLSGANFNAARLTKVDFTDAVVENASFYYTTSRGFTKEQLYSTRSYKAKNLGGVDLGNNNLSRWDFSDFSLRGASFDYSTLTRTDFSGADVFGANFSYTTSRGFTKEQLYSTRSYEEKDLGGIRLAGNDLSGWDFSGANLYDASFSSSTLAGTDFSGSEVSGADFSDTTSRGFTKEQLYSTRSYEEKNLSGVILEDNVLSDWDFSGFNLRVASFDYSTLTGTDFSGAEVFGAYFRDAVLTSCDFSDADLRGASFFGSVLKDVDFTGAKLGSVRFTDAVLRNADFSGQNLRFADFSSADLTGADFRDAVFASGSGNEPFASSTLTGADFRGSNADLSSVQSSFNATIDAGGEIRSFAAFSGSGAMLRIREHGTAATLSDEDAGLTNGTGIALDCGAALRLDGGLRVGAGSTLAVSSNGDGNTVLTVASETSLVFEEASVLRLSVDGGVRNGVSAVVVNGGGNVSFSSGAGLLVSFNGALGAEVLDENQSLSVMRWDDAAIDGWENFSKEAGNIDFVMNGKRYDPSCWNYEIDGNALKLNLDVVFVDIMEEKQTAKLHGDAYIANFDPDLERFSGTISGDGMVQAEGNLKFSGDAGNYVGTLAVLGGVFEIEEDGVVGGDIFVFQNADFRLAGTREFSNALSGDGMFETAGDITLTGDLSGFSGETAVTSGVLTVAESAALGEGDFSVAGTLRLVGNRTLSNAVSGNGLVAVASGTTVFEKDVGTELRIDGGATAKFAGTAEGLAGAISGAGTFVSTRDFALSGDLSGFTGTVRVEGGRLSVAKGVALGGGDFDVAAGTLALSGDRVFDSETRGAGTLEVASGTTTFARPLGVNALSIASGATAAFDGVALAQSETRVGGTLRVNEVAEIATALSGDGTVRVYGNSTLSSDAGSFAGTLMVQRGTLTVAESAELGASMKFELAGTLALAGERDFAAGTSGNGTVRLESGASVSFSKPVGAGNLHVVSGAALNGSVSLSGGKSAVLALDGALVLDVGRGERVLLGGGTAVLSETAELRLTDETAAGEGVSADAAQTKFSASAGSKVADGAEIPIFVNGRVRGDVEAFLSSDETLRNCAEDRVVLYSARDGLSVQVVRVAKDALESVDMPSGTESAFFALADDLGLHTQAGFYERESSAAADDALANAILTNPSAARDMAMNILPVSYAAMAAMTIGGFHSDARSVSERLEQRRYDRDFEGTAQFYAQAQGTSVENGSGNDAPNFDYWTSGILAGTDYKFGASTVVGVAISAEYGEARIHEGGGKLKMTDFRLTGYLGKTFDDRFYVDAGAQIGSAGFDVRRKSAWGDPRGDATVWNGGAFVEAGMLIPFENAFALTPYVGLSYMHAWSEDFEEKGDGAMWDVDSIGADSLRARVGCGVSWMFEIGGTKCRLGADVAYSRDFLGDEVDIDADYLDSGRGLPTITAKAMPEDVFSVGPTFSVDVSENLGFFAGYEFSAGTESSTNHSANVGVRVRY